MKRLLIALITALAFAPSVQAFTAAEPAAIVDGEGVGAAFGKVNVVFDTLWNETQEPVGDCGSGLVLQGVTQSGTRTCVSGGGSGTWLGLTDTPSAFTSNYWVKVNAAGTALELVTAPTGTGDMLSSNNLSDVASSTVSATNLGLGVGNSPTFTGLALTGTATVDTINEQTTDEGVTVEGVKMEDGEVTATSLVVNGIDGARGVIHYNNTVANTGTAGEIAQNSGVMQTYIGGDWEDNAYVSDLTSSNTNLLQFINSDLGTADSGGTKVVRLPTAVNWDDAELYCDGTITGLNIVVEHATTPDGTYAAYATVTATGSIDTSGWANATAGTWVRARVSVVSTGDADTCWMPINSLNN